MNRRSIEAIYPLSPMQRGMLFHTLYAPNARAYFEQLTYALEGPLDVGSLLGAWQRVLDRHPIFRTQFVWNHRHEPLQVVRRQVPLPWTVHDCRELPSDELGARLEAIRVADVGRGFDLTSAPLTRLIFIQAEDELSYLIWSFHHALLDRWSVSVVTREVSQLYEGLARGLEPSLAPSPSYQNYVRWCLRQDRSRAEAFWSRTLQGIMSPIVLGSDRAPGVASAAPRYRQQRMSLSPEATAALRAFSRSHHLTMNTLLQGAWALVLSRDASLEDVVHGITVTTRPAELPGADAMVGCLINTLPLRIRVPPDEPALSWLQGLQAQLLELREYEHSSLVDIQGWSQVPRGLPLFESIVVFENIPLSESAPVDRSLEFRPISAAEPRTGYPLTVVGVPAQEMSLALIYDAVRFEEAAIARLLGELGTCLKWLAAAADQVLSTLPLADHQGAPVLPATAGSEPRSAAVAGSVAPRTAAEVTLAGIWSEVLGVKTVGRQDDFFALGGHSLRAMQVAARVRDAFDLELPLATIFEVPTLAQLAERIEAAGGIAPDRATAASTLRAPRLERHGGVRGQDQHPG